VIRRLSKKLGDPLLRGIEGDLLLELRQLEEDLDDGDREYFLFRSLPDSYLREPSELHVLQMLPALKEQKYEYHDE